MESIDTALQCMKQNCYMTSVDLKDALFLYQCMLPTKNF